MPVPLAALVPLLIGGGLGAKMMQSKIENDRTNERIQMILGQTMGTPAAAPAQPPQVQGAMQPTQAPKVETPAAAPSAQGAAPQQPQVRPGYMTDLAILPTNQLLSPGSVPMYAKGMSIDEKGGINIQMGRDESQLDAMWFDQFQKNRERINLQRPGTSPLEADFEAMAQTISNSKRLPTPQIMTMLDPARRDKMSEQIYWKSVMQLKNSPDVRRAFILMARQDGVNLTEQGLDAALQHYALRAVANDMGGYMPEDVRKNLINLEGPPISPELAQKAFQMFGVANPKDITQQQAIQAHQALKKEALEQKRGEATAQALGAEEAAQQIAAQELGQPLGPIGRQATEKRAVGEVELELADKRPVTRELAEALQVPVGTTMGELKDKGLIQVPQWVQKNRADVWDALDQLEKLHNYAKELITADPNFWSVIKQAGTLKWERLVKTNPKAAAYMRLADGLLSVMARNVASERGVLNEGDIVRAKKLRSGDFSSAQEMELVFTDMEELMAGRLANAEKAALPNKAKGKATKRWNPKTGKLEDIE